MSRPAWPPLCVGGAVSMVQGSARSAVSECGLLCFPSVGSGRLASAQQSPMVAKYGIAKSNEKTEKTVSFAFQQPPPFAWAGAQLEAPAAARRGRAPRSPPSPPPVPPPPSPRRPPRLPPSFPTVSALLPAAVCACICAAVLSVSPSPPSNSFCVLSTESGGDVDVDTPLLISSVGPGPPRAPGL